MTDITIGTATDKELAGLHKRVAEVMLNALEQQSGASRLWVRLHTVDISELSDDDQNVIRDTLEFLYKAAEVNPALLQAVTKFLRDNSITAEVEETPEMKALANRLAGKKKRTVDNVVHLSDA